MFKFCPQVLNWVQVLKGRKINKKFQLLQKFKKSPLGNCKNVLYIVQVHWMNINYSQVSKSPLGTCTCKNVLYKFIGGL